MPAGLEPAVAAITLQAITSPLSAASGIAAALSSAPARRALLGEGQRPFAGVGGREDRFDDDLSAGPELIDGPVGRAGDDRLVAATASGPLAAIARRAHGRGQRPPGAVSRLTRPKWWRAARRGLTGQRELHGDLVGYPPGQPQQAARGGHQAALDLREAELRVVRRDDQVAGQRDLAAAGQRVALDRGDERLGRGRLSEPPKPRPGMGRSRPGRPSGPFPRRTCRPRR